MCLPGIVYCFSRKDTEQVTKELISRGIKAACYHADIDYHVKSRNHRDWVSCKVQVSHFPLKVHHAMLSRCSTPNTTSDVVQLNSMQFNSRQQYTNIYESILNCYKNFHKISMKRKVTIGNAVAHFPGGVVF